MTNIKTGIAIFSLLLLAGCRIETNDGQMHEAAISGARSGAISTDLIVRNAESLKQHRSAAFLGIAVSEYLSIGNLMDAAQGALNAIAIETEIRERQHTVSDPDFELLQAFADALQADMSDLLNRSMDRQQALDSYVTALKNVAMRSNERYDQLTEAATELKALLRTQGKERTDAERSLKSAIQNKQFAEAGELQKILAEKQQAYAETDLKTKQTDDIVATLGSLLTLYGEKILAIEQNREILIAGTRIVDVPGIEELRIIERRSGAASRYGKKSGAFRSLFEGL